MLIPDKKGGTAMNQTIDLMPYLPAAPAKRTTKSRRRPAPMHTLALALETLTTAVIGACTMIGTIVFFLLLC